MHRNLKIDIQKAEHQANGKETEFCKANFTTFWKAVETLVCDKLIINTIELK